MRSKLVVIVLFIFFISSFIIAQENKKETFAVKTTSQPIIDGVLDDDTWPNLPVLTDFVQYNPYNGSPASQRTEAKICYDDYALYVGAFMHDTAPDSMLMELGPRDFQPRANAQLFTVHVSPFNDGINSVYFSVSISGVQSDFTLSAEGMDINWNAVWQSEVSIVDSGWTAEIRIPFSALRFSNVKVQDWGLNLYRKIPRYSEWNNWSYVDNELDQWWKHMGELKGISDVNPPTRLSFIPYVSSYAENNTKDNWGYSYNGGLDLKYGLTESFTLDMTLIPDFGQVQSDDVELNLSPFEIAYNERRQFFTEGTELFNKGNIFYSRRIGSKPVAYGDVEDMLEGAEKISDNPGETQLINVTKLSGRTSSGLGIGVLNAMTADTYATVKDSITGVEREILTQPFTNYNMFVFDKTLPNNSYVSLGNSNVWRSGYFANVTATDFRFADKSNDYSVNGAGGISHIKEWDENTTGYRYFVKAGKVSGEIQYDYSLSVISDKYDHNDLGYLARNNEVVHRVSFSHNIYKPFGIFRNLHNSVWVNYNRMFNPNAYSDFVAHYSIRTNFMNNYFFEMHAMLRPFDRDDYYETRTDGRFIKREKLFHNCFTLTTDRVQPFSTMIHYGFRNSYDYEFNTNSWNVYLNPIYRLSDKLNFEYELSYRVYDNQLGYVDKDKDNDIIYFGKRNRRTMTNTFTTSYIFNNKMSLSCRMRHYWSKADYDSYYELLDDGHLQLTDYDENEDLNYNAFNVDMVFKWEFSPGSELLLVWKNSINCESEYLVHDYFRNLGDTIKSPQINSLSVKFLYYLDYISL